jgi:hypothetical protein
VWTNKKSVWIHRILHCVTQTSPSSVTDRGTYGRNSSLPFLLAEVTLGLIFKKPWNLFPRSMCILLVTSGHPKVPPPSCSFSLWKWQVNHLPSQSDSSCASTFSSGVSQGASVSLSPGSQHEEDQNSVMATFPTLASDNGQMMPRSPVPKVSSDLYFLGSGRSFSLVGGK